MEMIKDYVSYKTRTLIREGNIICYGKPTDPVMLIMTVLTTKVVGGVEVSDQIFIQLQTTPANENGITVLKQTEKNGLFEALDIGTIWLDRELKKNQ
ncbi:MAG: hypothetical protein IJV00_02470 [Clostridia bacterium]|nr:hypothetical protein [Clostridia bacterium]